MPIIDYIPIGREDAISARKLAELLDTTPRAVTKSIEALRLRKIPICASSDSEGGYYRPRDANELSSYLAQRNHRARTVAQATLAMTDALDEMRGQESLFHRNEKAAPEDGEKNSLVR